MSSISEYIINNEKQFYGATKIKYIYIPAEQKSDILIIGFSGSQQYGTKAVYNYAKYLRPFKKANLLFILDEYDGYPCYYLGKNNNLDYATSTIALIYSIMNENDIKKENVITCGSSKGGSAAIYFSLMYDFGYTIAGGFQYYVGSYLYKIAQRADEKGKNIKEMLHSITGGNITEQCKILLNNRFQGLFDIPKLSYNTKFLLHVGDKDYHYENHVLPFISELEKRQYKYELDLQPYEDHNLVGEYFSKYLVNQISRILDEPIILSANASKIFDNEIKFSCTTTGNFLAHNDVQYAFYVFDMIDLKNPIKKYPYTSKNEIAFKGEGGKNYTARVFMRKGKNTPIAQRTNVIKL